MEDEKTVLVPFMGRDIEMRRPSDGSMVVMARISRGLPSSEVDPSTLTIAQRTKLMRDIGAAGKILESCIVNEADLDWLDDLLIAGDTDPESAIKLVGQAAEALSTQAAPTNGPVASVRRSRR